MTKICGHCLKPFNSLVSTKIYCCKICKRGAMEMRKWHRNNDATIRKREKNKYNLRKLKVKWADEGKCVRCGHENDNAFLNLRLCSQCREYLLINK